MINRFDKMFPARRPRLIGDGAKSNEVNCHDCENAHSHLYTEIDGLRTRPGDLVPLIIPEEPVDLREILQQTVVVSEAPDTPETKSSIHDLTTLKTVSLNMNALGGPRNDEFYRKDSINEGDPDYGKMERVRDNQRKLLEFLEEHEKHAHIVCLQDVPIYLMRFIGPRLNNLGYSYYANVFGSNGNDGGHIVANVTLINAKTFASEGYVIKDASLSVTPHTQGSRRIVTKDGTVSYEYGSHEAEIEDVEQNYGKGHSDEATTHNAFQTLNTSIVIEGSDGHRHLNIGNAYMSPWSLMVERSISLKDSLKNLNKLHRDKNSINIFMGDTNSYGTDTTAKNLLPAHPILTGPAAVLRADLNEGKHMIKVAERQGYVASDSEKPTITALGGMIGMKLDRVFSNGEKVSAHPVDVDFTDHRALFSDIDLKPIE